jgi:type III restriction enzyme
VSVVDRLSIVAHDRFQEIIDEANRPDSVIRLAQVILDPATDLQKTRTVVAQSNLAQQIGATPTVSGATSFPFASPAAPVFASDAERTIARAAYEVIRNFERLRRSRRCRASR